MKPKYPPLIPPSGLSGALASVQAPKPTALAALPNLPAAGGYTPDYGNLISNDPLLRQQSGDLSAQGIASDADRRAAVQRALIQWGEIPDLQGGISGMGLDPNSPMYKMLFGDVDEHTRQAAKAMTDAHLSQSWGLQNQHAGNVDDLMSRLAARGMVRSGATVSGLGQEDQQYNQAQFNGRNDLLTYLSGVQSAFAQGQADRQRQLAAATSDAATRQIAEHPYVAGTDRSPFSLLAPATSSAPSGLPKMPPSTWSPTPATPPAATAPTSYTNSVVKRLNIPE